MVNRPKILPSVDSIKALKANQTEKAKTELDSILRRISLRISKELQAAGGYLIR